MEQIPNWPAYYAQQVGRPPRNTLLFAMEKFAAPRKAVDLGCGEGRDTIALLEKGWQVLAIDSNPLAFTYMQQRLAATNQSRLTTQVAGFGEATWATVALVNASFCLPFCPPSLFPRVWAQIVDSLEPGGRFAGHLFGDRDTWAKIPGRTHHCREEVDQLLESLVVEFWQEEENDGITVLNEEKHWHIFHIVARKNG